MEAFYIRKYGGPEVLERGRLPTPVLGLQDVRIRVHAASVNPLDWRIREGQLKVLLPYRFPLVLGNDCSGVAIEVGREVSRFRAGDAVYTRAEKDRIGTFATEIVADEVVVARKPVALSRVEAASLLLVLLTAAQFLAEAAALKRGQSVLIHAGAGAVGSVTIQLAKHLGLRVISTASGGNITFVKGLGADRVIDRQTQRFEHDVRDIDAVLDSVGMSNLLRSFQCVKPGGNVVSIADDPDVSLASALGVNRLLRPVFWARGARPHAAARRVGAKYRYWFMRADGPQLESLNPLLESGTIRPYVGSIFPFDQAPHAIAKGEEGKARGKVAIQMLDD
ncbi:Zinc-type alcohol dehydrogenase-like protein [Paraburkholderia nemoris]|uniref:NADP-dependent oxidoreductase n=1 Tax=Paraburkholderia nemoris TaxID=2793076 RepID=UPI00190E072C|nr:NADP-dependent oxidoreductase [Paraburkholderia nemoris]MBK3742565.1 NADP-dependent oxidoreductase [Paraburkholderia aspalathi]CAE6787509.1 Zinc-type alcohol dehydrogenase-like protein [Paraburkholderia nemoris]